MSSIHIHLNSHAACGVHARQDNARHAHQNDLRQGLAAMLVLAMLERILNAATQGANRNAAHGCGGTSPNAANAAHGPQTDAPGGGQPQGALQPFLALLLLLALLFKQGDGSGHGGPGANEASARVADGLGSQAPDGMAQEQVSEPEPVAEAETEAEVEVESEVDTDSPMPGIEDSIAMMASAIRQGHADSLLAGTGEAELELRIREMSTSMREAFSVGAADAGGDDGPATGADLQGEQDAALRFGDHH